MKSVYSKSLVLIAAFYFTANLQAQEKKDDTREKKIDEVVLIGYGGVKKSNLTSAVSTVKADAFNDRPISNVAQAIQGNAAGVNVVQPSGKPGATMDVKIRGNNSITSSTTPLYVVDGVQTTDISGLNTDDIVDMSILKDATSTAIYGTKGSNGVVIITTKRGKANKIGSIANQGYTSTKTSFPNNNLQSPTGTASALCKNNIANILAKAPVKRLAIAPCLVTFGQYKEQK